MKKVGVEELKMVEGGGLSSWGIVAVTGAVVAFLSGFFDGLTRPYRCR